MKGQAHFWGCKGVLPEFPQTYPKNLCVQIFSHKNDEELFLGGHTEIITCFVWPPKKDSSCVSFLRKKKVTFRRFSSVSLIYHTVITKVPIFSGILPGFSTNQKFLGALSPLHPPPTPLNIASLSNELIGRVALSPSSIVTRLWYCDNTWRSDIVTKQECSLAISARPRHFRVSVCVAA